MEGLGEDFTRCECVELTAAIYVRKDVFRSGPTDMGQTGPVTHSIDTWEHCPMWTSAT